MIFWRWLTVAIVAASVLGVIYALVGEDYVQAILASAVIALVVGWYLKAAFGD